MPAAVPPLRQAVQARPQRAPDPRHARPGPARHQDPKLVDEAITNLRTALAREDTSAMGYRQLAAAYARKAEAAKAARRQEAIHGASRACIGGSLFL